MEQTTYAAFISYRHQSPDQEIAKALHTAIETYGIPAAIKKKTGRKRMGKVFRDQEELPLSADLGSDIETALDRSEWFIAICSPRYQESRWCLREMEYFIARKGRERVLTVLVEGEPCDSFPDMIRFTENEAGERVETEPLAANVRAESLSKSIKALKQEKLRILAPMLGLGFDDLKRRARQRKIRIAAAIAAAAVAVGIGTGVFLAVNHARNEELKREAAEQARLAEEQAKLAEEQRRIAEEEQRRAEEERKTAVFNDLGERMERASAALTGGEKREAAKILTDALALSDENEKVRHDEIIGLLRRAMYIEPFSTVFRFNNQNMQLLDLTPSPDGTRAIAIVNNNSIAMIDLFKNEILYSVSVDNSAVANLSFSADGTRFMAECDYSRLVQVWNSADGSEAFRYVSRENRQYEICNVCFWTDADTILVQDADRFLLVSADGTERLFYTYGDQMEGYDPDNNILTKLFQKPVREAFKEVADGYGGVQLLVTKDRDKVIVTGLTGETATVVLDGNGQKLFFLGAPTDPACKMPGSMMEKYSVSPDGKTLSCVSYFGAMFGWDLDTGDMIFIDALELGQGAFPTVPVYTPDSQRMAYAVGNVLTVADARTNAAILTANIDDTRFSPNVSFTSDGKYMLMTNESAFIINTETWALEWMESPPEGTNYSLRPAGDLILCARYDGEVRLISTPSLASVQTTDGFDAPLCEPYLPQRAASCVPLIGEHQFSSTFLTASAYKNYPNELYFSRDGSVAALAYPDGAIELFDTQGDGKVKEMIGQLYNYIQTLAITEDRLIAADVDARMLVYNLNTHSVETITNDGVMYASFAFNPDGSLMLALCAGKTRIDVFDLNDGCRLLFSLHATADTFTDMAFTQDSAYAVGVTASGKTVVGDLWRDEAALLERTRRFMGQ